MSRDPYAALRSPNYRLFALGGFASALGGQIFSIALGWELYERTHDPGALGLLGLLQAVPVVALALPAGDLADRKDRRGILLWTLPFVFFCMLGLAYLSWSNAPLWSLYALLLVEALFQATANPARSALLPQLVEQEDLANAIAWNTSRWQLASLGGPALGGFLLAIFHVAWPSYAIAAGALFLFWICVFFLRPLPMAEREVTTEGVLERLAAGAAFVRSQPLILAAISLDMLAVLFGGATALLPVFAKDILEVGPTGLGYLRAAPAVGALCVSLTIAYRSPLKRAGVALLWAVAGFGIATIVFGLSKNFYLSLLALALTGATDNISVVVRHTLVQATTPRHMQGRVSAVNSVFIGISNELGAAESGYVARWLGAVLSVLTGGIGTVLVVLGVAKKWPQLQELGPLESLRPEKES
ncbi:MFS transporter [Armatimonas rosea]|uniref:MFS family permease n=1 Tax=Armatimonas rosea TaxID=685828 RepID=A0A7W9SSS1_ARMRO|nr:MFS transporter [Armatimonas rosea]MBB6052182.1 MFS family permease [Armatimonas rosea]